MSARVILYELNEVPWAVVDRYVTLRPDSQLAALVCSSQSLTTRVEDSHSLQPWRTWPTLHKSLNTEAHNSIHLGQDPTTFRGKTIWDAAEAAGRRVGLFGPLQSWPARPFAHGGFYVPDTFSRDARTYPASMSRFQAFNLAATRDNVFSSEARFSAVQLTKVGVDLLRQGLSAYSAAAIGQQLVREKMDDRYRARRSIIQVLPSFDLYWRLHRQHRPHLSVFFTNHVAAMMHRFWGDGMPAYADEYPYQADPVFGKFVIDAMDLVDRQIGCIRRYLVRDSNTVLIVAASMGQAPVRPGHDMTNTFVLADVDRLIEKLGLDGARPGLAMYPRVSLELKDRSDACETVASLESVQSVQGESMFSGVESSGRTVSFDVHFGSHSPALEGPLTFAPRGADGGSTVGRCEELGIASRGRLGGGNTAYHIPDGMLMAYGRAIAKDSSRRLVSVLDVAPSLLANLLDVEPSGSMRGEPSLFT